jgi:type VI secretion system protein ImpA
MSIADLIDATAVLSPIPGDDPAGADMSFSPEFDVIQQARRADDQRLAQGAWQSDLKVAQWPVVKEKAVQVLASKSKDLQAALWLCEALAQLHGYAGLAQGFAVTRQLLTAYWEHLYPKAEDGSYEARAGKLAWLNNRLPMTIGEIPLTALEAGGLGMWHWDEAKALENQMARDPEALARGAQAGKTTPEAFERAVSLTNVQFYKDLAKDVQLATDEFRNLEAEVNRLMGVDAPSLATVKNSLDSARDVATRIAKEVGAIVSDEAAPNAAEPRDGAQTRTAWEEVSRVGDGPIRTRAEALQRLREVAVFFKRTEPHSPVSYLAEKAAAWGNMSLDEWLRSVVKDDNVMSQLAELLGSGRQPGS